MNQTSHILYVTLADPVSPEQKPHIGILDFACRWGVNANTEGMMASKLLLNGFRRHYIWNFDCHRLASDFVRMSASVGIPGRLHRWSSKFSPDDSGATVGSMVYQRTRAIDPVGGLYNGVVEWSWHQWAEVASSQCDPSAAVLMAGSWGTYEDYLFTHYQEVVAPLTLLQWVGNNAGQSVGCERFPDNCLYDSCTPLMWRGPDL